MKSFSTYLKYCICRKTLYVYDVGSKLGDLELNFSFKGLNPGDPKLPGSLDPLPADIEFSYLQGWSQVKNIELKGADP